MVSEDFRESNVMGLEKVGLAISDQVPVGKILPSKTCESAAALPDKACETQFRQGI